MSTDVLTAARQRIAGISLADEVFVMLTDGDPVRDPRLTDDTAAAVWTDVAKRLRGYGAGRYARTADVGLRDLHGRLTRLLGSVRSAGRGADLSGLVQRYRGLRAAQKALTNATVGRSQEVEFPELALRIPLARLLDFAGATANIDEAWPSWREFTRGNRFEAPPWEHPEGRPFDIQETAANLRWLASEQAKPWVPTLKQAAQAVAEQMQAEEARHLGLSRVQPANMSPGDDVTVVVATRPAGTF